MRKLVSAGVPARELGVIRQRGRRHCLDKLLGHSDGRRAVRHATDPARCEELAYAGNVITYDLTPDAQGLHHRHRVRLIVRQGGNNARLGQHGGHALAIRRRNVLDAYPVGNSKMASEFAEITLIRAASQNQQVGFGNLTHHVRQCLDDPVVSLVPFQSANGNDPARNGDCPGTRRW